MLQSKTNSNEMKDRAKKDNNLVLEAREIPGSQINSAKSADKQWPWGEIHLLSVSWRGCFGCTGTGNWEHQPPVRLNCGQVHNPARTAGPLTLALKNRIARLSGDKKQNRKQTRDAV